ncbi:copper resistance protein CopZ [Salipaludibacillus neizhouensis]|uniref:Copper chaperone CopZ n=2 Tax=Salipaludibacillus neizhouensis TaxID=885475 RepID=A0A3A9KCN8_9BACI|nr:copper chaperone CopZ [Salipaludibacillus neizhouensis]RKL69408.1 copper resistance protein CopZ [Salipaludibacillus neizhouensis]
MKKEVILVKGMTCNHCKSSVEGALKNLEGVSNADVNLADNNVTVDYEEGAVTVAKMKEEIEEQGYDVI